MVWELPGEDDRDVKDKWIVGFTEVSTQILYKHKAVAKLRNFNFGITNCYGDYQGLVHTG